MGGYHVYIYVSISKYSSFCLSVCMHACMDGWMDGWMDGCICVYARRKKELKLTLLQETSYGAWSCIPNAERR